MERRAAPRKPVLMSGVIKFADSTVNCLPMIAKKRKIMVKRLGWLELQGEAAIAADPSLLDAEAVGGAIFRARYGEERWEQRLARTQKHGVGVLDYPFAGEKKKKDPVHPHFSQ
jgi:hypothetical protein